MLDQIAQLGIDVSEFVREINKANAKLDELNNQGKKAAEGVGVLESGMKKLVALFSVGAITGFVRSIGQAASEIQDTADRLDITAESVQGLSDYFSESGAKASDFDKAMVKLNQTLDDARGGNEKALSSFEKLGITWQDIATKSPDGILKLIADGMKDAVNPTEAMAAALDLLGKSGEKLIPGLKAGSAEMERFANAATKFSNEEVAKIDKAFDDIARSVKKASVEIAQFWMQLGSKEGRANLAYQLGIANAPTTHLSDDEFKKKMAEADARIAQRKSGAPTEPAIPEDPRIAAEKEKASKGELKDKIDKEKEFQRILREDDKEYLDQKRKDNEEFAKDKSEKEKERIKSQREMETKEYKTWLETKNRMEDEAFDNAEENRKFKEKKREEAIDEKLKSPDQRRAESREAAKRDRTGRAIDKAAQEAENTRAKNEGRKARDLKADVPGNGADGKKPSDGFSATDSQNLQKIAAALAVRS